MAKRKENGTTGEDIEFGMQSGIYLMLITDYSKTATVQIGTNENGSPRMSDPFPGFRTQYVYLGETIKEAKGNVPENYEDADYDGWTEASYLGARPVARGIKKFRKAADQVANFGVPFFCEFTKELQNPKLPYDRATNYFVKTYEEVRF